ncbi:MAG: polyphenol oxidase family protein [Brooklawnia sp.]
MFDTLITPGQAGAVGIAFTDRHGGASTGSRHSLNLGRSDIDPIPSLRTNMSLVRQHLGIGPVVGLHQVHGRGVYMVDDDPRDWSGDAWLGDRVGLPALPVADAAVTGTHGLALMVRVADCVPVLFADASAGLVGAAHAGRAGLLGGVLEATVAALRARGARSLQAWIGPHICGSCYEVPAPMAAEAADQLPQCAATTSWGTPAIDMGAGAAALLTGLDVAVTGHAPCTMTSDALFSHRGDGQQTGRQAGLVWLH